MVEKRLDLLMITFYSKFTGVNMFELKPILDEIFDEIKRKGQYDCKDLIDEDLLLTEILLSELLDPSNAYPYKKYGSIYYYEDDSGVRFCVRNAGMPTTVDPHFELKTWWVDPDTKKAVYQYLPPNTSGLTMNRRTDTIEKIFSDEIIPEFEKQNWSDLMMIKPVDSKRYQFSLRMVKKFIPKDWEIIEDFPKKIMIRKK